VDHLLFTLSIGWCLSHIGGSMNSRTGIALKTSATIAILAVIAAAGWLLEPVVVWPLGMGAMLGIGAPMAVTALLVLSLDRQTHFRRPALQLLHGAFALGCLCGTTILLNQLVYDRAVNAAKEFASRLEPLVESYRKAHGSFPASLEDLSAVVQLPRLYRNDAYSMEDGAWSLQFRNPETFWHQWAYDSSSRTWRVLD
jgi:hypothetical protein